LGYGAVLFCDVQGGSRNLGDWNMFLAHSPDSLRDIRVILDQGVWVSWGVLSDEIDGLARSVGFYGAAACFIPSLLARPPRYLVRIVVSTHPEARVVEHIGNGGQVIAVDLAPPPAWEEKREK
jgi:hypothetical protein